MASPSPGSSGFRCLKAQGLEAGESALPGSLLFGLGLAGNGLALALLWRHRRASRLRRQCALPPERPRASAFYLLACALVGTDLLGKCLLSPMVLAAYAKNRSLLALGPAGGGEDAGGGGGGGGGGREGASTAPGGLCQAFAFLMAFFGLAPTALLLGMALECYFSLAQPYFYERHTSRRRGALLAALVGALCALLCALPLLGFGDLVQYCPGTWCFMRLRGKGHEFAVLYATLLGTLVLAVAATNLGTMRCLYRMALRQPPRHPWARNRNRTRRGAFPGSGATEELAQLALLALMTALFTVCSLPVIIRAYVGAFAPDYDEKADLTALRFFSVNSIVDPWVFIIFRTSLFRSWLRRLSWRLSSKKSSCGQQQESWQRQGSGPLQ